MITLKTTIDEEAEVAEVTLRDHRTLAEQYASWATLRDDLLASTIARLLRPWTDLEQIAIDELDHLERMALAYALAWQKAFGHARI